MKNTKTNAKFIKPFGEAILRFSGPKLSWAMEALANHGPEAESFGIEEGQNNTFLVDIKTNRRLSKFHPEKPPGWMDERTRAIAMRRSLETRRKLKV